MLDLLNIHPLIKILSVPSIIQIDPTKPSVPHNRTRIDKIYTGDEKKWQSTNARFSFRSYLISTTIKIRISIVVLMKFLYVPNNKSSHGTVYTWRSVVFRGTPRAYVIRSLFRLFTRKIDFHLGRTCTHELFTCWKKISATSQTVDVREGFCKNHRANAPTRCISIR